MKKFFTLLFVLCLAMASSTAWAESVSESQARSIAEGFMSSHAMPSATLKMATRAPRMGTPSSDKAAYYVFNNERGGYVIVAGDDRAPAVLGYSDKDCFDPQNVPDALQELLEGYTAQMEALDRGAQPVTMRSSGSAIRPLVTAQWSQNAPYNTLLPLLPNGSTQAVAGCVATAMAQVLYYWKQPAQVTTAIPAYTSTNYSIYMPELEPVDFNWDAMQDTYLNNDTESEAALAAARLTLYCAQSVQMNFLYGSSGAKASDIPTALSTYFDFKASSHCEYRENYTTQGWADYIYNELAEGRPVIYSGSKASSGHAFICDGYNGEGMFHINWGWNGMSNGYYLLNVLNPDQQGTGAANEAYGYIYGQYIVAGIEPGEDYSEFALTAGDVALNGAVTTRASSTEYFKATVTGRFYNYTGQEMGVSFGWGLYDGETLLSTLDSSNGILPSGYCFSTVNKELSFGRNITSGTYRIVPIYSMMYFTNWHPCKGADVNYIEVTIDGNTCTVTGHGSAGERSYIVNAITHQGALYHGHPVDLAVNLTNNGYSHDDLLYMFVNNSFYSTGLVGLEHGETGDIGFRFLPTTPGDYTCKFSFNQDGSDPLCQTTVTIDEMPAYDLSGTCEVLNVTDATHRIITSDKFSIRLTITNNGEETYNDDIMVKLYKNLNDNSGTNAQNLNRPITLAPGETTTLEVDLDNVIDGWKYFVNVYYYSGGQRLRIAQTQFYTIVFPEVPQIVLGDVNGDNAVDISDATMLINYLLSGNADGINLENANCDQNGGVDISDATTLINYLLNGTWP
ncbi:MAG: C10 family peptidase [Muribaculaceae bacterium]|nr:C10 family peptidase [Muribaculaceae bacterium]